MNSPLSLRAVLVFAALALLPLTPWMSKYYLLLAFDALLFGAVAMSLDLLIGYTGLVSFGHAAFFGLGAYSAAVLLERGVTSLWLSLGLSVVVVGLYALLVSYFATTRRGIYFALLTLIFAEVVYTVFRYTQAFGGSDGIQGLPAPSVLPGVLVDTPARNYYLVVVYLFLAYLGRHAGEKVLAGHIRRGDGGDIHAVIWFCDLRDSTPLADSMSRQDFLRLLNDYFECVLGPVMERGGEVLRFIGDAALAIFPIGTQPVGEACAQAVAAAKEAISRMQKLNQGRAVALRFGIGLHLGDVMYGNIGTPSRIEFTVIGAAANEAARIESLCKVLKVPLIASEKVVKHLSRGEWKSLGRHALRGVGNEMELFTAIS